MTPDRAGPPGPDLDDTVLVPPRPELSAERRAALLDEDTVPVTGFLRGAPLGGRLPHRSAAARAASGPPTLRLVLPDGSVVVLDTTVILGRRPSTPRIYVGPVPRLVALPSARREVSATHVEFRRVGETVVVSDLRSTNGTTVTTPGSAPRVLLGGDSAVVSPGTVVDLGDGNALRVEALA